MGVFIKKDNQWTLCKDIKEGGSTNSDLEALGYDHNQFYSYMNFNMPYDYDENGDNILSVCLKVMTEDIICVITCPARKTLTDEEVLYYMKDFDFANDYSRFTMESDLDSAIAEHNYSIQFVAEALGLKYSPDDKLLHSDRFKYNFYFEGGFLTGYEISDGYNREAHEMKEQGSWIYDLIEKHAANYHSSNEDAMINEINIQANAFQNLPGGITNEYKESFKNADGSYNFKMLLVAKYQGSEYEQGISYEDCKCVCHNELKFEGDIEEGLDKLVKYRYRDYILIFDDKGSLKSCEYNKDTSRTVQKSVESETTNSPQSSGSGCMVTLVSLLCLMMMLAAIIIVY